MTVAYLTDAILPLLTSMSEIALKNLKTSCTCLSMINIICKAREYVKANYFDFNEQTFKKYMVYRGTYCKLLKQ